MNADMNGDNSNSTAGIGYPGKFSDDRGTFSSIQYGSGGHAHHHHSSTNMIAHINGDNSNSTAGSDDRGTFSSIQYAWNHPRHHQQNDMIANID